MSSPLLAGRASIEPPVLGPFAAVSPIAAWENEGGGLAGLEGSSASQPLTPRIVASGRGTEPAVD